MNSQQKLDQLKEIIEAIEPSVTGAKAIFGPRAAIVLHFYDVPTELMLDLVSQGYELAESQSNVWIKIDKVTDIGEICLFAKDADTVRTAVKYAQNETRHTGSLQA